MTVDKKRNGCGRLAYRPLSQSENTSKGFSAKNYRTDIETWDVRAGGVLELPLIRRVKGMNVAARGNLLSPDVQRMWSLEFPCSEHVSEILTPRGSTQPGKARAGGCACEWALAGASNSEPQKATENKTGCSCFEYIKNKNIHEDRGKPLPGISSIHRFAHFIKHLLGAHYTLSSLLGTRNKNLRPHRT